MSQPKNVDLHLVRHYPYLDTPESREFEEMVRRKAKGRTFSKAEAAYLEELESRLSHHATFESLPDRVRTSIERIFEDPDKILLCYDPDGKPREIDTALDLARYFEIPQERVRSAFDPDMRQLGDFSFVQQFRESVNAILKSLDDGSRKIDKVILVGRRSHAHAFAKYRENQKISPAEARGELEREGVSTHFLDHGPEMGMDLHEVLHMVGVSRSRRQSKAVVLGRNVFVNGRVERNVRRMMKEYDVVEYGKLRIDVRIGRFGKPATVVS